MIRYALAFLAVTAVGALCWGAGERARVSRWQERAEASEATSEALRASLAAQEHRLRQARAATERLHQELERVRAAAADYDAITDWIEERDDAEDPVPGVLRGTLERLCQRDPGCDPGGAGGAGGAGRAAPSGGPAAAPGRDGG